MADLMAGTEQTLVGNFKPLVPNSSHHNRTPVVTKAYATYSNAWNNTLMISFLFCGMTLRIGYTILYCFTFCNHAVTIMHFEKKMHL